MVQRAIRLDDQAAGAPSWAVETLSASQRWILVVILVGGTTGLAVAPSQAAGFLLVLSASYYICHIIFHLVVWTVGLWPSPTFELQRPDADLPVYSIIVPLYREANMAQTILSALQHLDYPYEQLDVLLAVECDDDETLAAIGRVQLPHWIRTIVVPEGYPRTKPRACNHALQFARGEFVVVYDAEDRPEPAQLRDAIAAFDGYGPEIVCLQARLIPFNADETWMARMFAIDYCQWFDSTLTGLRRLGFPIPLGGTSNHFRRAALIEAGAWDAYNVTEDADLGLRLHRQGQGVRTIPSTTFEEAPLWPVAWIRQRTRWIKGYIQTFFVHLRAPSRLGLKPLSLKAMLFIVLFIGGSFLFAAINPILWAVLIVHWCGVILPPAWWLGPEVQQIALVSLLAGNGIAILRAMLGPLQRGWWWLSPWGLAVPVYWVFLSIAAYRAAYGFARNPFKWDKTHHGVTAVTAGDVQ